MRIAMVGPFGFHPNKTMRSRALQLAKPLAQRGHTVRLLMPPWQTPEDAGRVWQEEGVEIQYTDLGGGTTGITYRLLRDTLAWKPEVVHTFKPKAYSGLVAWWLWNFRQRDIRLVTDADDWEGRGGWNDLAPYSPLQKRFFAWQEKWGLRHNHVLTVASRTLQSLAWANGVPPGKVVYIPNGPGIGVDTSQAAERRKELGLSDRPVLLLYSRLFEFEPARLIEILGLVRDEVPDLAVLAVGLGLYEEDASVFRKQLEAAGLQDMIVDLGWVDEAALPNTLASADVGVYLMDDTLLNRTKCPVKLADILHVGLPVVAENVGQVSEYVIPGRTGLLCAPGQTTEVARGIVRLLKDREERQRLGLGAREYIQEKFAWGKLAQIAESAYSQ